MLYGSVLRDNLPILLHYNAPFRIAPTLPEVLKHYPYSRGMNPYDFDLFPQLKEAFQYKTFPDMSSGPKDSPLLSSTINPC
ncbi:hypothetical protein NPIL_234621 [Nephila pilipes]|uniref:Uncharacterized protein n=1 Tax=Nephila pilipes TaxID=299642 RepID=A0A8X6QB91_NEPPI|nr:hypothetical protein NPIL_234621 [Nephila pilipes]